MELSLPIEETPITFEDYSIMCNLPNEILSHIFACLQAEDRKSVRLVCKLWYHSCTFSRITTKEKYVFRTQSSIEDITKVMLKSHSSILNLEFQGLPVDRLPIDVWKECGNRIHSLEFYVCYWEDETIENVIVHCINLISLTFRGIGICNFSSIYKKDILCLPERLDKIIERGIRRPKLQTFTAFIDHPSTEIIVDKFFHIYPCIRHFAACTISRNLIFHFPNSLKSLKFINAPSSAVTRKEESNLMEAYIAKAKQGLRLKYFDGTFENMQISSTREIFLNFFSLQEDLRSIKLLLLDDRSSPNNYYSYKEIFFHILKSCPSLQEYYFEFRNYTFLTFKWRECPQFLSSISKLQSLHLRVCVCSDDPSISSDSLPPPVLTLSKNLVLTTLELNLSIVDYGKEQDYLCAALFKHCPLLLHLKLHDCSDYTLSIIFEYLLKLQTLILLYNYYNLCNKYGFTGHDASRQEKFSIKRLQQLKYLSISSWNWKSIKPLTERIMLQIQSPHLEFLEFNINFLSSLEEELINRLSSQIPKLRFLSLIYGVEKEFSSSSKHGCKLLQLLMYLKNLHHIQIDSLNCDLSIIEKIFRACPSLKYVSSYVHMFLFDPIASEIQKHDSCKFKFNTNDFDIFSQILIDDSLHFTVCPRKLLRMMKLISNNII